MPAHCGGLTLCTRWVEQLRLKETAFKSLTFQFSEYAPANGWAYNLRPQRHAVWRQLAGQIHCPAH